MVPGRPEGDFSHEPAGWKDDEVGDGGPQVVRLGGQDSEDGRIRVVEGDGTYRVEASEVVFVGVVGTVPGDNIEGRMILCCGKEVPREFGEDGVGGLSAVIFCEGGDWGLEVARVRETVGSDGPKFGEIEVALVQFEDVAPYRASWK